MSNLSTESTVNSAWGGQWEGSLERVTFELSFEGCVLIRSGEKREVWWRKQQKQRHRG